VADNDAGLDLLLQLVRRDFGPTCLWNVRTDLPNGQFAQLAARKLRKYGGMAGWRVAQSLDAMVAAARGM
jgi:hypothetical protein